MNKISFNYNNTFEDIINIYRDIDIDNNNNVIVFKYYVNINSIEKEYYYLYDLNSCNKTFEINIENIMSYAKINNLSKKILSVEYNNQDITNLILKYMGPYSSFNSIYKSVDFRYLFNFSKECILDHKKSTNPKLTILYGDLTKYVLDLQENEYDCNKIDKN